jgi:cobalt/nickel transport system ATP-binding protein
VSPVVEVSDLSVRIGSKTVLDGISFTIGAGERVGLAGGNGAGKSTLLWCLLGLLPARGVVRLFGEKPGRRVLARTGTVFQNPEDQLFMPAVADDLRLVLRNGGASPEASRHQAFEALKRAGLAERAGEPAAHLSPGQRKRAAIALALSRAPELLILDEPTAELDGRSVRDLIGMVSAIPGALLIASHDLEFLRRTTTRIIVLAGKRTVADAPAEHVLSDTALLESAHLL